MLIRCLEVSHGHFHTWNGRGLALHLDSHIRLHLGKHEVFTEKGNLADDIAVKTVGPFSQEHLQFARIPRPLWAHAKFVCPYCETMCSSQGSCAHLISDEGHLLQSLAKSPSFENAFELMRQGGTIPNLPNLQLPGIRIKGEAVHFGENWLRLSCIYAETPQSLEPFMAAIAAYVEFVRGKCSP